MPIYVIRTKYKKSDPWLTASNPMTSSSKQRGSNTGPRRRSYGNNSDWGQFQVACENLR